MPVNGERPSQAVRPQDSASVWLVAVLDAVTGRLAKAGSADSRSAVPGAHTCRGEISDAVVMEGRGFGFVTFATRESAQAFLTQREHTIGEEAA